MSRREKTGSRSIRFPERKERDPWEAYEAFMEELIQTGWITEDMTPSVKHAADLAENYCECCGRGTYEEWAAAQEERRHPEWGPCYWICGF